MTEVSVIFPSNGSLDVQHRENVEVNQEVGWRVQSFNPDVARVKITFEDATDTFFLTLGGQSHESPERGLTYSGAPGHEFGTANIYGRAPKTSPAKIAKYTVTGITGDVDIVQDPVIVIHTEPTAPAVTNKLDP